MESALFFVYWDKPVFPWAKQLHFTNYYEL